MIFKQIQSTGRYIVENKRIGRSYSFPGRFPDTVTIKKFIFGIITEGSDAIVLDKLRNNKTKFHINYSFYYDLFLR